MVEVSGIWIYPIKSCRGIALETGRLAPDGLDRDRHWMVVDEEGRFITQRQHPRMALIETQLGDDSLRVSAAGAHGIEIPFVAEGRRRSVTVWRDVCDAIDVGDGAAAWFSDVLGVQCRLVAFEGEARRTCDPHYTGDSIATTQFADGFPLLVIGEASLVALNERLAERAVGPVDMSRFRPNLTVRGIDAFDEDHIRDLRSDNGVRLRLVKPCARCLVTTVDPREGLRDPAGEPLATLNGFRVDPDFGTVFGLNAIVIDGVGRSLSRGERLAVGWNF